MRASNMPRAVLGKVDALGIGYRAQSGDWADREGDQPTNNTSVTTDNRIRVICTSLKFRYGMVARTGRSINTATVGMFFTV